MIKKVSLLITLLCCALTTLAQVRFSSNANVYNNKTGQKIGNQYIAANIGSNGTGTVTLGALTLKAIVTSSKRDNIYKMTAYSVTLYSKNGKTVEAVITKRDKGTYVIVVYYSDGALRYEF